MLDPANLLGHLPPPFHLVLVTRSDPPLPRLQVRGHLSGHVALQPRSEFSMHQWPGTTSREVEGKSKCRWQGAKPIDHLVAGLACGPYRHCARELGADPDPTHFDPSALVVGGAGSGPLDQRNRWRGRQREWADWRFPVRTV